MSDAPKLYIALSAANAMAAARKPHASNTLETNHNEHPKAPICVTHRAQKIRFSSTCNSVISVWTLRVKGSAISRFIWVPPDLVTLVVSNQKTGRKPLSLRKAKVTSTLAFAVTELLEF